MRWSLLFRKAVNSAATVKLPVTPPCVLPSFALSCAADKLFNLNEKNPHSF